MYLLFRTVNNQIIGGYARSVFTTFVPSLICILIILGAVVALVADEKEIIVNGQNIYAEEFDYIVVIYARNENGILKDYIVINSLSDYAAFKSGAN